MACSEDLLAAVKAMAEVIEENKDWLTDLDRPIGDSDHGINMARGFKEVEKKCSGMEGKDAGTILKTVGMTLVSTVGGSAGPLYGTAFMKAGMALAGKTEFSMADILVAFDQAIAGVKQRGKSEAGEKTMLDAMIPALETMKQAEIQGKSRKEIFAEGVKAAWAGTQSTKDMLATKGRASYVGARGIGHQDPGATSFSLLLEAVSRSTKTGAGQVEMVLNAEMEEDSGR